MKIFLLICFIGIFSMNKNVSCEESSTVVSPDLVDEFFNANVNVETKTEPSADTETQTEPSAEFNIRIHVDEILRQITSALLNSRGNADGFYNVAEDGSIDFVPNKESKDDSTSPLSIEESSISTSSAPSSSSSPVITSTAEPNLSNDEESGLIDWNYQGDYDDESLWELVPKEVDVVDPLKDPNQYPLVDTNEVEYEPKEEKSLKSFFLQRTKRDVKVDVGQQDSGSGLVDVAVNKPGKNVNVNVAGIEAFLSQFGVHFSKPEGSGGHASSGASSSAGAVNVNVDKPNGGASNVDVNVGGPGGKPGSVNVNKPGQTNVNVDWASLFPFVNVAVNKGQGANKVDVNVGQTGAGGPGGVDVKVNKGPKPQAQPLQAHEPIGNNYIPHKNVDVNVGGAFVDVKVDAKQPGNPGDIPPPPPFPHHKPPKKHRRPHHPRPHDDEDKNVNVNVGSWWPFVNVNVDSAKSANAGKYPPRKCVNINVPFVNVIVNRGCKELNSGDGPSASASASASSSGSASASVAA